MQREKLYKYSVDHQYIGKNSSEIFTEIYQKNIWSSSESISGPGSTIEQTRELVKIIPQIIEIYKISSILDIPCGDFNWIKDIHLTNVKYFGADIVNELVMRNNQQFGNQNKSFVTLDLTKDKLEQFDLILCRDCLVHFSFSDIYASISNIRKSKSKYLLTTTFTNQKINNDIHTGGWRPINLMLKPFSFPEPKFTINENCTEMNGRFSDKCLGLWIIEELK